MACAQVGGVFIAARSREVVLIKKRKVKMKRRKEKLDFSDLLDSMTIYMVPGREILKIRKSHSTQRAICLIHTLQILVIK